MTIVDRYRIVGENATQAAFRAAVRDSQNAAGQIQKAFRGAFAGISAIAIGRSVFNWSKQAIDQADAIGTLAQSFGTTSEELSRLDYTAKQSNTSLDELTSGLTAFQKNLVLAGEDSGKARKALAELHADAEKITRLPLGQQLEAIAEAFRTVENPAERVRIAAQLFGDEVGRKMIPILALGRTGIRALGEESDRLGNTLTTEVVEKLQATDAEFKRIEAQSMVLKRELAIGLGPAIAAIGGAFVTAAKGAREFGETIARALHGPDEPAAILQEQLGELAQRRGEILTVIRRLEAAPELVLPATFEKWRTELRGVESEMNRVNSALQQFGRDAAAAGESAQAPLAPLEVGVTRALTTAQALKKLVDELRSSFPHTIASGEAMLNRPLGPSDAENAQHLGQVFRGIQQELVPVTDRTIQLGGALQLANVEAEGLMTTLKDESARQAFTAISDVIYGMGEGMDDFAKNAIDAFRRILANKITEDLFGLLAGIGGGGSAGGFLGAIGGFFSNLLPGKAGGGPVSSGNAHLVGEHGAELFMPNVGGMILPNHKLAAAGGAARAVTLHYAPVTHIDSRTDQQAIRQYVDAANAENSRQIVAALRDLNSRGRSF
jgi:hypothetical protein